MKSLLILTSCILLSLVVNAQQETAYESKFVTADGVKLHYLDFGGEGLPLIFLHSESWDATTYKDFGSKFTDTNRVIALTRKGYGASGGHDQEYTVSSQAESIIAFLDAMDFERAVFAGNSSPTAYMTYLAEHYPERVAGVIYLAGLFPLWHQDVRGLDPYGAGAMAERAYNGDSLAQAKAIMLNEYKPDYLTSPDPTISVPALAFAGRHGRIGYEGINNALLIVGSHTLDDWYAELPESPIQEHLIRVANDNDYRLKQLEQIKDPEVRTYFMNFAEDDSVQTLVYKHQLQYTRPILYEFQEQFKAAFEDDRLTIVKLDVPAVFGYEYQFAPELIHSHIHKFLIDIQ